MKMNMNMKMNTHMMKWINEHEHSFYPGVTS